MTDAELIARARARVRAYIDRRAIANGYDPEHIHGYDVSKSSPNGIALTVPDLTTLLDALQAAQAKLAKAVEALEDLVRDCEADYPPSHGAIKYFARATLAEIKGESHD
jgi:hypothetical protein